MSAQPLYKIVRARRQLHREIEIAKKRERERESYRVAQELNLLRTPFFFFTNWKGFLDDLLLALSTALGSDRYLCITK